MSTQQITFSVPGMSCGHCVAAIEGELGNIAAVASASADLDSKIVTITGDGLDTEALIAAIDEAGYEAELVGADAGSSAQHE